MKIVLTGDLHLGCTSTRIPEEWRQNCRTVQAWLRLVDAVIEAQADLLLLSGDILDRRNLLWEAMGPLQQGVERLSQAGVRCIAVSGNHDASSLPELAAQFSNDVFTLLGKGGKWQRETLSENGNPVLHVDGWSFPSPVVRNDPTLDYPAQSPTDDIPVLGMVHGDPGVSDSKYAPLSLSRLQSLPVSAWLLGHIHRSTFIEGSPWVLMPGSPHPLDPGEPGAHHAWVCELSEGKLSAPLPFCPARLEYSELEIPVSAAEPPSAELLRDKIQQAAEENLNAPMNLIRLQLNGHSAEIDSWQECSENLKDWSPENFRIEKVQFSIHPLLDLAEVAKAGPVPALLVSALETLPQDLHDRLRVVCDSLNRHTVFSGKELPAFEISDLSLQQLLEQHLRKTLEQLK
ncbi:DNA repair exonuclease [Kiritimatiellaeota bacterium B1221]|nr:DNA repair exonuclease [Kiritimatiellaeota bacterium B1221]